MNKEYKKRLALKKIIRKRKKEKKENVKKRQKVSKKGVSRHHVLPASKVEVAGRLVLHCFQPAGRGRRHYTFIKYQRLFFFFGGVGKSNA